MTSTDQTWTEPRFLAEASAWIRAHLEVAGCQADGEIAQIHVRPWSTVLQVPTARGTVYFKANHNVLRHEAAVADLLGERRPDFVPRPLAVDTERGWMLMADAGVRLRELVESERSLDGWFEVLRLYAGLQLDLAGSVDQLLALGVPDMRLEVLPELYKSLVDELATRGGVPSEVVDRARARVAEVREMCSALAQYGIPESIQHDDLNDGQVFLLDGRYRLLDWADACISHPFFSLSVALEGVIAWGVDDVENSVDIGPFRDAYLEPFEERLGVSLSRLREAAGIAIRLGWACRAVNGHAGEPDPEPTVRRLQMFLDGRVKD